MAMDIGAVTPFLCALREREYINDFIEELCGARLTYNYHRIGGVAFDMPKGWADKVKTWLDHFEPIIDEFDRLITYNEIFIKRLANVARHHRGRGDRLGPGRPEPARLRREVGPPQGRCPTRSTPTSSSTCPSARGEFGDRGRLLGPLLRAAWRRCARAPKILRQALAKIPEDDRTIRRQAAPEDQAPEGRGLRRIESARGDMGCYVIGGPGGEALPGALPHRQLHRDGHHRGQPRPGLFLADLVALIACLDVVAPEIDR